MKREDPEMVERRLGRGLDFFLSRSDKGGKDGGPVGTEVVDVELSALRPSPFQPRQQFHESELKELADSIRSNGLLQPILVRRVGQQLEIVAGERRWRASKLAGLERIPAIVKEISDESAAVFALVENVQRTDLNPLEKAKAFKRLTELTGASQDDLARRMGLDRSTVANFVRLLDLSEPVQSMVSRGTITMGHARALVGLSADQQVLLAEQAIRDRWTVRDIEARAQELKQPGSPKASTSPGGNGKKQRPIWLHEIEDTLADTLGTAVNVKYGRKRATITIECVGRAEFERVYELLKSVEKA